MILYITCIAKPGNEDGYDYIFGVNLLEGVVHSQQLCRFKLPMDAPLSKRAIVEQALETIGSPNKVERVELSSEVLELVKRWRRGELLRIATGNIETAAQLADCIDWDLFEEKHG